MIVQFQLQNFRSFSNSQIFSMRSQSKSVKNKELPNNEILIGEEKFLKSAVLYGGNASGKSNFLRAFGHFAFIIQNSMNFVESGILNLNPYVIDPDSEKKPTEFEVIIYLNNSYYRYGFSADLNGIQEEWLYVKKVKQSKVFHRIANSIEVGDSYKILKDKTFQKTIHKNSLILSKGATFNEAICGILYKYIANTFIVLTPQDNLFRNYSISGLNDTMKFNFILNLLQSADTGIESIVLHNHEVDQFSFQIQNNSGRLETTNPEVIKGMLQQDVKTVRTRTDGSELFTFFSEMESEGTQKLFHLSGILYDCLKEGRPLIIDELDTKFHPLLSKRIIELFQNESTNPKHSQLIFATHDTSLLSKEIFRRDQIWFVEKDRSGSSHLIPLSDYNIRNDLDIRKNYLEGKFGAIPYLGNFDFFNNYTKEYV
jgi:hypothetical protein